MATAVKFKDYDKQTREEFAKKGWAIPDPESGGAFPIATKDDLTDALHRVGSTKMSRAKVIAHIRKRARALGALDMLGENTSPTKSKSGATSQANPNNAARFSARKLTPDGMVLRQGKVFEAGSRVDMHGIPFIVTPEELASMVMNFKPIPIGTGHPEAPSPLDGHLGTVTNFFLGRDPKDLLAEVAIPPFVDDVLGDGDAKVSMVFDRITKEPLGLDFVNDPNVVDAALVAAFARHDTPGGKAVMQTIHDVAARRGAICRPTGGDGAGFASLREHNAVQQIHDITSAHGADCEGVSQHAQQPEQKDSQETAAVSKNAKPTEPTAGGGIKWKKFWRAMFAEADRYDKGTQSAGTPSEDYEADWQEAKTSGLGADSGPDIEDHYRSTWQEEESGGMTEPYDDDADEHDPMNGSHAHGIYGLHEHQGDNDHTNVPQTELTEANPMAPAGDRLNNAQATATLRTAAPRPDPEAEMLRMRNRELEAELNRERATRIEQEAIAFAEGEVQALRSLPVEQEMLIELYRQANADDSVLGVVKLANGTVVRRTERLRMLFSNRPEHWMTREQMSAALSPDVLTAAMATAQSGVQKPMDENKKAEYLAQTELGRSVLAARASSNHKN
jgi:hypothetical protein